MQEIHQYRERLEQLGLNPGNCVLIERPWPIALVRVWYPSGSLARAPLPFHDLFAAQRHCLLREHLNPRRRDYEFRRGVVGFTPAGSRWTISWTGVLEGVGIWIPRESLAHGAEFAGVTSPTDLNWRLALADHAPAIAHLAIELAQQSLSDFPYGRGYSEQLAATLLTMIARRYATGARAQALRPVARHPRLALALRYIEEHLDERISAEDISLAAGASIPHLNRCFRAEVSSSIWQYVRTQRLERSRLLLQSTSLPVTEVARASGFASASHFVTSFRRVYGVTPQVFRETHSAR